MTKAQLNQILSSNYDPENWKELLRFIFPNVSLFQVPQTISVSNERVKSFRQLGNVRLNDGKTLAIFDIELDEHINIIANRVALRNLTAKYIDQTTYHGVLAVFTSNSDDYRFTFTAKDTEFDENLDLVTTQTEPKRYTYVLGPNETCKTPTDRFFKLHDQRDTITLETVLEAFSIEKLNREFFDKYKEHYENFVEHITGKRIQKVSGKWKEVKTHEPHVYLETVFENDNKKARDFIKKLLGRMVFIQFLQKKGWMGCSKNSVQWKNGDPKYCFHLFENANKDKFHSNYLSPLFDALNTPNRNNDLFELAQNRVPYLNGGLFEADTMQIQKMDFPASYFHELLDFFSQYNFTIDENDPHDHEIGIDPEMLGHIFENLLEDNKDKGAFYTPKSIVQYICQDSLIQYLKNNLYEYNKLELEEFVRTFNKGDENDKNNYIQKNAKQIGELLDKVKICDPAIGSGAFPMGILQIIYRLKITLDPNLDRASVKRNIIQNSIYGVDIEKGAIDIARLRFWLSLIVDERIPQPLPNLDYKIIQGNSLLESFEDVDLKFDHKRFKTVAYEPEVDIFGNPLESQVSITDYLTTSEGTSQLDIDRLENEYFNTHDTEKKTQIKAELDQFERSFISDCLKQKQNDLENEITHLKKKVTGITEKAKTNKLTKLNKIKNQISESHVKLDNMSSDNKPYFLWHLYFMDVFKNGGFDIVIANPPYVDIKNLPNDIVVLMFNKYHTAHNRINLYSIFIEFALKISNKNGIISFINPNSILMNSSYFKLRSLIVNDVDKIIKLPDNVFTNATVETILLFIKKNSPNKNVLGAYYKNSENINFLNINFKQFLKTLWKEDDSCRFNIFIDENISLLTNKLSKMQSKLSDHFLFSLGITPYDKYVGHSKSLIENREFHSDTKINKRYKPLISGKNVHSYMVENSISEYIKYGDWLGSPRQEKFFTSPRIIVRQIVSGDDMTIHAGYTDQDLYHTQIGFSIIEDPASDLSIKYLLAIINSSIIKFFHKYKFLDFEKKTFQKILIENCKKFPIPKDFEGKQSELIEIVDNILEIKSLNDNTDTQRFEVQIDKILYEMYELTDEEIQIIESSV